jgi:hypothetical protein
MRLIRLFYEPYEVLSELQDAGWAPAFMACVALSFLAKLAVLNVMGLDVKTIRTRIDAQWGQGGSVVAVFVYAGTTLQMVIGLW